jgi:cytochrome b subunit of formate dehydrogenase/mono/diheme cytochrome c family protein
MSKKPSAPVKQPREYARFHWAQRVAHILLLVSFTTLGLTGLPQKYAMAGWAQAMIKFFGGIEATRLIHHIAAVALMFLTVYHILDIGYKLFVKRSRMSMLPALQDVKDAIQAFLYNLGFGKHRPQMGRYTFEEKMEYWALVWGTIIMGLTGFMMWNPIASVRLLPGEIIPASKAAHGGEALLAVLAIIVWHMYGVHLRRFNKSMWTGKLSEEEMLHDHPLELADIKAGLAERPVDPKTLRKRRTIYYPVAAFLTVAMLAGVYGFVSVEKTAITTVPPIPNAVPVYVPQTPTPTPTLPPAPSMDATTLTWDGGLGALFQAKCGACHSAKMTLGQLSFAAYADALKGGQNGAAILPGDAAGSLLIQKQQAGGHPGQFSAEELAQVSQWIAAGAPEK